MLKSFPVLFLIALTLSPQQQDGPGDGAGSGNGGQADVHVTPSALELPIGRELTLTGSHSEVPNLSLIHI